MKELEQDEQPPAARVKEVRKMAEYHNKMNNNFERAITVWLDWCVQIKSKLQLKDGEEKKPEPLPVLKSPTKKGGKKQPLKVLSNMEQLAESLGIQLGTSSPYFSWAPQPEIVRHLVE